MNNLRLIVLACLSVAFFAASCRKADEVPATDNGKARSPCAETCKVMKSSSSVAEMSQDEMYTAEFERLVVSSNMTVVATERQTSALCEEISKLSDKEYALCLYDRFLDMAIAQEVTETNLYLKAVWYEQLLYVGREVFFRGQSMKKESFERWKRFFCFLEKYTNEIVTMEKALQKDSSRYFNLESYRSDMGKRDYLFKFKGHLKIEIQNFRKYAFPALSEGLTEEQKADILRRFDDVLKLAEGSPEFSSGKTIRIGTNAPAKVVHPITIPAKQKE